MDQIYTPPFSYNTDIPADQVFLEMIAPSDYCLKDRLRSLEVDTVHYKMMLMEVADPSHKADKDSNLEKGLQPGTKPAAHRDYGLKSQVTEVALGLQPLHHIVMMKGQMMAVQLDIMEKVPVQVEVKPGELVFVLEFACQQAADGGIYKFCQTCIVPFSHNMNTLSHPVAMDIHNNLVTQD